MGRTKRPLGLRGYGGIQDHQCEECEAEGEVQDVQHGHLPIGWSDHELGPEG